MFRASSHSRSLLNGWETIRWKRPDGLRYKAVSVNWMCNVADG
jgi:hypothetical protein